MSSLSGYLPQDRLAALAAGVPLPDRTQGAALFADISGFTPLTESLTKEWGAKRGIEELSRRVNAVYDAIIVPVEEAGGSVLSFAGDAITCWFGGNGSLDAVEAARAMQSAMRRFPELGLKVSVTTGTARRFVLGLESVQRIDALAGATIARLAVAEHLAQRGQIVVDSATAEALGPALEVDSWRTAEDGQRFAVLSAAEPRPDRRPATPAPTLPAEVLRPWILPPVYSRETSGHGGFLTELRPAAILFVNFEGIDYDDDDAAGEKLDRLVCAIQSILDEGEGSLLQLTIGDKGSSLYAVYGAPTAHEDDARRVLRAALAIREACDGLSFLRPIRVGVGQGMLRTGAYGGSSRSTYGVLGDEVNLAARLMMAARPGQIVAAGSLHPALKEAFVFSALPPLLVKGKSEPVTVFQLDGRRARPAVWRAGGDLLPLVGRRREVELITAALEDTARGEGTVVGLSAEAGLGKSRLVAEAVRLASDRGLRVLGGACESSGTTTPFQAWVEVWRAFFDVDASDPLGPEAVLQAAVRRLAPNRVSAVPVLGPVLGMELPNTEFTAALDPGQRRSVLTAVLEECLAAASRSQRCLIVLEDAHWMDPSSLDLLVQLVRSSVHQGVGFLLAYRPSDGDSRLEVPRLQPLVLGRFDEEESREILTRKFRRLFPEAAGSVEAALLVPLVTRCEGNPFYLEELVNYLRDQGTVLPSAQALEAMDLPSNLQSLLLSRLDRLSEAQRALIKAASIIGRDFSLEWLVGYYPELGAVASLFPELDRLATLDLTPLARPDPPSYTFKHIMTREAAYGTLTDETKTNLHERLATYLETQGPDRHLNALAYHYGMSSNRLKKREYWAKAADAALAVCSYEAGCSLLEKAIPLLDTPSEQSRRWAQVAEARFRLGDFAAAESTLAVAEGLAGSGVDRAEVLFLQATLGLQVRGDYTAAVALLQEALPLVGAGDSSVKARVLYALGDACWRLGNNTEARRWLEESRDVSLRLGDTGRLLFALNRLSFVVDSRESRKHLLDETLRISEQTGNRERTMAALLNLAGYLESGEGSRAERYSVMLGYQQRALEVAKELGARQDAIVCTLNLAVTALWLGRLGLARPLLQEALSSALTLGAWTLVLAGVLYAGFFLALAGHREEALSYLAACARDPAFFHDLKLELEQILAELAVPAEVLAAESAAFTDLRAAIDGLRVALEGVKIAL